MFNQATQKWDPGEWADLFCRVGARYVVLTTKHHDGFLLWPSEHPNPFHDRHHAERDLVGELTDAVRERGMKMGLYYSGEASTGRSTIRSSAISATFRPPCRSRQTMSRTRTHTGAS